MTDRRPRTPWILATGLLTLFACGADSSGGASIKDPSNPQAPEGRPSLATPATAPADAGHGHASGAGDAAPLVYACPMHPEVTATQPGTCPKCLMKLVAR